MPLRFANIAGGHEQQRDEAQRVAALKDEIGLPETGKRHEPLIEVQAALRPTIASTTARPTSGARSQSSTRSIFASPDCQRRTVRSSTPSRAAIVSIEYPAFRRASRNKLPGVTPCSAGKDAGFTAFASGRRLQLMNAPPFLVLLPPLVLSRSQFLPPDSDPPPAAGQPRPHCASEPEPPRLAHLQPRRRTQLELQGYAVAA
jgi:hypothetical protein